MCPKGSLVLGLKSQSHFCLSPQKGTQLASHGGRGRGRWEEGVLCLEGKENRGRSVPLG